MGTLMTSAASAYLKPMISMRNSTSRVSGQPLEGEADQYVAAFAACSIAFIHKTFLLCDIFTAHSSFSEFIIMQVADHTKQPRAQLFSALGASFVAQGPFDSVLHQIFRAFRIPADRACISTQFGKEEFDLRKVGHILPIASGLREGFSSSRKFAPKSPSMHRISDKWPVRFSMRSRENTNTRFHRTAGWWITSRMQSDRRSSGSRQIVASP